MREAGLGCVNLTVHHDDQAVNDRIMLLGDTPGAIAIAAYLRSIGQRFRFNLSLQRGGIEDVEDLVRYLRWAFLLGAADVYVRELFDLQLYSPRTDTDRRPVDFTEIHRVSITPIVEALSTRKDFKLLSEQRELLRDKTEWTFLDLQTGHRAYSSRLTVGTESEQGTPYLVLMPDGELYRGWSGLNDKMGSVTGDLIIEQGHRIAVENPGKV
jgi:hypothetical protein